MSDDDDEREPESLRLARRHHRVGWWALAGFAAMGLVLESLQGFRTPWYVDADVETRHTMFRLAHAHGALLGLVNIAFALGLASGLLVRLEHAARTSTMLVAGSLAIPLGFVLGGAWFVGADPGYGILLVPLGAIALLASLLAIARAA